MSDKYVDQYIQQQKDARAKEDQRKRDQKQMGFFETSAAAGLGTIVAQMLFGNRGR